MNLSLATINNPSLSDLHDEAKLGMKELLHLLKKQRNLSISKLTEDNGRKGWGMLEGGRGRG